jgi:hypothetical protein
MSISDLGSNDPASNNDIGFRDVLAYSNRLPGDEVVIGTYDPLANTTPLGESDLRLPRSTM